MLRHLVTNIPNADRDVKPIFFFSSTQSLRNLPLSIERNTCLKKHVPKKTSGTPTGWKLHTITKKKNVIETSQSVCLFH